MRKIGAFIVGFVLFVGTAFAFHYYNDSSLSVNNTAFGTWINTYKDMSYDAIALNLGKNTMPVLGSSEFHHGVKTAYHPRKVFKDKDIDVMLVGSAYTQSLYHATLVGGIAPKLQNRKVVLIVSPSWFKKEGVKANAFAARFSESEYIAMLENPELSVDLKEDIANETLIGLGKYTDIRNRVKRYNRIFLTKNGTFGDRLYYYGRKLFINEKDKVSVISALKTTKIKKSSMENNNKIIEKSNIDWVKLTKDADRYSEKKAGDNPFYMYDNFYRKKIVPRLDNKRDSSLGDSYRQSPEYYDLNCFFKVCQQSDIEVKIIILPINGYWYDYTGFPIEEREQARIKVKEMAKKYDASVVDLYDNSYDKYFFEDAVHPSGKGWIKINEAILKFYEEN